MAALALPSSCLFAQQAPAKSTPEKAEEIPDYVRFVPDPADERRGELQTGISTFKHPDGYEIDLVGVVHFGDPGYYDRLNTLLASYDSVLYEMVGGPVGKNGKPTADRVDPITGETEPEPEATQDDEVMSALKGALKAATLDRLRLEYQKTGIDYTPENFVHADVTWKQFTSLKSERGEDMLGFVMRILQAQKGDNMPKFFGPEGRANVLMEQAMAALTEGDSLGLKRAMADVLGEADLLTEAIEGEKGSVIIGERNAVALKVALDQIARGKRRVAIFYGAAHMADFEERLVAAGFQKKRLRYETAWDLADDPDEPAGQVDLVKDVLLDEDFVLSVLRRMKASM